jgi:hypothetical protein
MMGYSTEFVLLSLTNYFSVISDEKRKKQVDQTLASHLHISVSHHCLTGVGRTVFSAT